MASKLEAYFELLHRYEERFGVGPPDFHFSSDAEGIKLMRKALRRGRPIQDDEIPQPGPGEDF